jgi:4-diphosphocytidyl-2-C-methyl-D-erythritol kinase
MVTSVMQRGGAKINVGLHLVGKRADGYHLLETLFYPVQHMFDMMLVERDEGEGCLIKMEGIDEQIALEDNLVYKAWRLMTENLEKKNAGVRIRLRKGIPAGAGLGGGSSNAATAMKALRDLWKVDVTDQQLATWGAKLGADVPFFVYEKPMYGTGIGTHLEPFPIDLGQYELRLQLFNIHSSTIQAYRDVDPEDISHITPLEDLLTLPISEWRHHIVNDLEKPVFARYPVLAEKKAELYKLGAVYAAMSGSGSAIYGLFER